MTNEEINKWLSNLKDDIGKAQHQELWHYAEALDMAIEALSFVQYDLSRMPSAEQKKAHWVWDENAIDWGLGAWVCSGCRCRNDNIIAEKNTNPLMWVGSKYCPQCGAQMGEKKDD